ncbi:QRFPR protein, partial [Polypterus senegalus]
MEPNRAELKNSMSHAALWKSEALLQPTGAAILHSGRDNALCTLCPPVLPFRECPGQVKYDFLYDQHYICCLEKWIGPSHQKIYTTFILVILFLLPLTLMLILYSKIGYELWVRKKVGDISVLQTIHGKEMGKIARKKKRAIMMMVTVVVLFTVCWAPFHVIHMKIEYSSFENEYDEVTIKMVFAVVHVVGFFNSICNPIVYAFMNENFKKNFLSALCFCALKDGTMSFRRQHNSGCTSLSQPRLGFTQRDNLVDESKKDFAEGNIEVRFLEQPFPIRNSARCMTLFVSEVTVHPQNLVSSFSMDSSKHLRSFTAGEKLKVILEAEKIGNQAAGRKYGVPESCVRDWRRKKEKLSSCNKNRRAFRRKCTLNTSYTITTCVENGAKRFS